LDLYVEAWSGKRTLRMDFGGRCRMKTQHLGILDGFTVCEARSLGVREDRKEKRSSQGLHI
jgi:hypothetical protein